MRKTHSYIVMLFVMLFVSTTAFAQERTVLDAANKAFVRASNLKKERVRVQMKLKDRFSRRDAVISNGDPTPEKSDLMFYFNGVTDENKVLIGEDVVTTFSPVNPMRNFVNGYRTDKDAVFQTTTPANPGSEFGLVCGGVSELHGINVVLPGKIGLYGIESQIDWSKDYYFSSNYLHVLDHLGAISSICLLPDGSVKIVIVANTFDKKFPSSVEVTMNDISLVPVAPVAMKKDGFLNFVTIVLANEDYARLQENANEYGASFILRGDNGVIIQWNDYLPPLEYLPSCDGTCYDPTTGEQVPCN